MNSDKLLAKLITETIKRERRSINEQVTAAIAANKTNKSRVIYTKIIGWR